MLRISRNDVIYLGNAPQSQRIRDETPAAVFLNGVPTRITDISFSIIALNKITDVANAKKVYPGAPQRNQYILNTAVSQNPAFGFDFQGRYLGDVSTQSDIGLGHVRTATSEGVSATLMVSVSCTWCAQKTMDSLSSSNSDSDFGDFQVTACVRTSSYCQLRWDAFADGVGRKH